MVRAKCTPSTTVLSAVQQQNYEANKPHPFCPSSALESSSYAPRLVLCFNHRQIYRPMPSPIPDSLTWYAKSQIMSCVLLLTITKAIACSPVFTVLCKISVEIKFQPEQGPAYLYRQNQDQVPPVSELIVAKSSLRTTWWHRCWSCCFFGASLQELVVSIGRDVYQPASRGCVL